MASMMNLLRNASIATLLGGSLVLTGCGAGGVGVEIDAPILNAVGLDLGGKKKDEEDLPERAGLVVPPSTAALPAPGTQTAAASQEWPNDPDKRKKREAEEQEAAREQYCREGNWKGDAGIDEFNKNIGEQQRCQSKLGEALNKSFGGRSSEDK
jgi:hypothetical protein